MSPPPPPLLLDSLVKLHFFNASKMRHLAPCINPIWIWDLEAWELDLSGGYYLMQSMACLEVEVDGGIFEAGGHEVKQALH